MATGGNIGDGVKVAFSITSPLSWTQVTQVANVDFPGLEPDAVNNDVHGSAGFHREMPGLFTVAPMVITVSSDLDESTTADHNTLWGLMLQKTTVWWRVEVPVDRAKTKFTGFEFEGYVGGFVPTTPIDDRQMSEITVRFDGTAFGRDASGASEI